MLSKRLIIFIRHAIHIVYAMLNLQLSLFIRHVMHMLQVYYN